ncbi:ribonuclease H-like domain-containing protein [Tanacetum coccineum]
MEVKSVNKENTHRQEEYPRKSQSPRDNRRNSNGMMTQKLGNSFEFIKKACFMCGSFNHLIKDFKAARVNNVTTIGPKALVSAAVGNRENVVKSSACWIWRPIGNVIDHTSKDSGSYKFKRFDYVDLQGRLKLVMAYYQVVDGGFVAFAGSPKGGKITRKGKIRTGNLDFEDVYFVKELKFNLFSVLQMRDKNNNVLFTETKCIVLSPDFKLLNESQVLLKVPRQNNMYSFDLKSVVIQEFCGMKGIKSEFSVARTPQQNEVAKRKNRTLIEAARTMLADSLLPTTFWAKAVSTACYVQNRVLVTKPHNKTPYELLHGIPPSISFMRPFGCLVTILNTLDRLGKFDEKADKGFFVEYSINSKAFCVFNTRTRKLVTTGNQTNKNAGIKDNVDAVSTQQYILKKGYANNTNKDSTISLSVSTIGQNFTNADDLPIDPLMPDLEDTGIFSGTYDDEDVGAEADLNNLETTMNVYVDDIIFGSTKKSLCIEVESLMHKKFQMSSMGELTIFLGLQVMQRDDGIFISQDKYVANILKKFDFSLVKTASTPIETNKALLKDEEAGDVDTHKPRKAKRTTKISQSSGPIHLVADETDYKEWEDIMERVATTASSLEAKQNSGNINRTQSMTTLNESLP